LNRWCSAGSRACGGVRGSGLYRCANHGEVRLLRGHVEGEDRAAVRCHRRESVSDPQQVTMGCCHSSVRAAAERQFSGKRATDDLAKYRAKGPGSTTRLLLAGLARAGPQRGPLLDVGSGVGALTFELLDQGMTSAVGVDLSAAYVAAASQEAARRGRSYSTRFIHADFLDVVGELPTAAVVMLDRVVCCYPDCEGLLDVSLRRAERYVGISYPRDVWYVRTWVGIQNVGRQLRRNPFRTFVHSPSAMENVIRRAGFSLFSRGCTRTWRADVYRRA
jgi:SAM-dependent methyltransferase